jgi:hypothetical protein
MIQIKQTTKALTVKLLFVVTIAVVLGWLYLWYFGLPPYYGVLLSVYPGPVDPNLEHKIDRLMAEVKKKHPDPTLRTKVYRIPKEWSKTVKRPGLAVVPLGLGALPYVEEMTRSADPKERSIAYNMLWDFSIVGKHRSAMSPSEKDIESLLNTKYICPLWERALYDSEPSIRRFAIKCASWEYLEEGYLSIAECCETLI